MQTSRGAQSNSSVRQAASLQHPDIDAVHRADRYAGRVHAEDDETRSAREQQLTCDARHLICIVGCLRDVIDLVVAKLQVSDHAMRD